MDSTSRVDSGTGLRDGRRAGEPTFERFTDRARRVVVLAEEDARVMGQDFIGTGHLLLGLIHEGDGVAAKAIGQFGVSLESARELVEGFSGPLETTAEEPPAFTKSAMKVLELARIESTESGQTYIATWHILLGLLRESDGVGARVLSGLGADLHKMRDQVVGLLEIEESGGEIGGFTDSGSIASVVSKGIKPADYAAAYCELSAVAFSRGIELESLDPSDIDVRSVTTADGHGLELRIKSGRSNRRVTQE